MKPQDSVSIVTEAVKLPPSVTVYLQNNAESDDECFINGGVLQDTQYAWLSSGSKFTVVNVATGQKIAAWTFGSVLHDFKTKITCVYKLPTPLLEQSMQILIGLECELIGGMVCLFHCNGSRILRAIQVACRVTCLQYVEDFPGGPLNCFDGTVLIGTHGGATLAFDLNRQSCVEAILNGTSGVEVLIKDELNVANLVVLSIDDISLIVEQREIACNKDDHIAIQINEGCIHNLQYILHNPDNTIRLRDNRENVFISSILYVSQLNSVILGLNFGAFQLWNLLTLELEFTSHVNADRLPITHLGFLEPCDDPRAFCYLWAIYSSIDRLEEGFPLATMYALTYHGKSTLKGRGSLYENFATCNLRFNIDLTSIEIGSTQAMQMVGGRSLACHSLIKDAGNTEDGDESVLNICQMVWECWPVSAIAPVQSLMILFDIDQWYKEQMPDCTTLETNRYMSVINLSDTLAHTASSYLCDVRINTESLAPYYSVQRLEEHFYPNALGYECCCLTNTDITKISTMGVQRQILASINEIGPSVLLHPTKLFLQCVNSGLIPLYIDPMPSSKTPVPLQRQMILSIALEARLIELLAKCASDWATGSHSSVGCTLQLLTEWAWSRALTLKINGDQLTIPLFDHSGMLPDKNSARSLENCTTQLGHIAALLNIIVNKCSFFMLPEVVKETMQRQKAVQIVSLYFQVVQWFLNVGLLPEFHIDNQTHFEESNERLPYPVDSLVRFYQNRRFKLHCLNGENPANENLQDKSCSLLFIDQFTKMECSEENVKPMWIDDGSSINGLYPPPSLYSLLRTYLIPDIKEEIKHALVLYVLVDYAMMFDDNRYECVIRRLMQFPTMFGLSNTAIKVTQAFWHLDHRDFEFALDQLQCVLAGGCLTQWQHNVVLSSLLAQKKTQSALQYLHVRKPSSFAHNPGGISNSSVIVYDDWQACCNLYLSRGLVLEAFNLVKESYTNEAIDVMEKRLVVFLQGCRKMGLLSKVLRMPLSNDEEEVFIQYLKGFGDSESNNLLVMYYLQRSRYVEAQLVNEDVKHLTSKSQLPYDYTSDFTMKKEHVQKTNARDLLVELYCKTLPRITRNLAHYSSGNLSNQKMSMPTPMTVSIQENNSKHVLYKSSFIQATIDKASETWSEKPIIARGLKRVLQVENTPFICSPKMPGHSARLGYVEKMSTTPDGAGSEATPSKRQKIDDSQSTPSAELITNPKLKKEMEQLLHTPTIERKSRWGVRSGSSRRCSADRMSSHREATPQSILKVRRLLERATTPLEGRHLAETDDEIETASQHTQSDNLSRSIRFNIPSASGTPSPSSDCGIEMNESFNDLFPHDYRHHSKNTSPRLSNVGASPRKSIHHSCETDAHISINAISTPIKDRSHNRGRNLVSASNSANSSFNASANEDVYLSSQSAESIHTTHLSPDISANQLSSEFKIPEINSRLHINNNHESFLENSTNKDHINSYIEDKSTNRTKSFTNVSEKYIDQHVIGNEKEVNTEEPRAIANEEILTKSVLQEISPKGPQPRRSLRQTPEREKSQLANQTPSPRRSLRQRSQTPELETPNKAKSTTLRSTPLQTSLRKSLARRVIESNILKTTDVSSSTVVTTKEVIRITESISLNSSLDKSHGTMADDNNSTNDGNKYDSARNFLNSLHKQSITALNNDSILASDQSVDDTLDVSQAIFNSESAVSRVESRNSSFHSVTSKETKYESFNNADNLLIESKVLEGENMSLLPAISSKEIEINTSETHEPDATLIAGKECDVDSNIDHGSSNSAGSDSAPLVIDLESDAKNIKSVAVEEQAEKINESILNISDSDSCASSRESVGIFNRDINDSNKMDTAHESAEEATSSDDENDSVDVEGGIANEYLVDEEVEQEDASGEEDKETESSEADLQIETENSDNDENISADDEGNESESESENENLEIEDSGESQSDSNSRAGSQVIDAEETSEDTANQADVESGSDVICVESSVSNGETENTEESEKKEASKETLALSNDVAVLSQHDKSDLPHFSSITKKTDFTSVLPEKSSVDSDSHMQNDVTKETDVNEPNHASEIQDSNAEVLNIVQSPETSQTVLDSSSKKPHTQEDINNMSLMTEEGSILEDSSFSLKYSGDEETNEAPDILAHNEKDITISNDPAVEDEKIESVKPPSDHGTPQKKSNRRMSSISSHGKNETSNDKKTESTEDNATVMPEVVEKPVENVIEVNDPLSHGDSVKPLTKSKRKASSDSTEKSSTIIKEIDSLDKQLVADDNLQVTESNLALESVTENETSSKKVSSPSSSKGKTPTRKKKTVSETKLNESLPLLETSISHSTRSASKKLLNTSTSDDKKQAKTRKSSKKSLTVDENDSVVSESNSVILSESESKLDTSFMSDSATKEDALSVASSRRKSRKSIFTFTKPNLSIIPEVSHLDSTKDSHASDTTNAVDDYSSNRRLTRHQRSMLEKTMESSPARQSLRNKKGRGSSLYSNSSTIQEDSESEGSDTEIEAADSHQNLAGESLDPIKLLDKEDFKATPRRARSETGSIAALRKSRKKSVDIDAPEKRETPVKVVVTPPSNPLDQSITDSPSGRPRRQSFNKAVEALSTPRRKRRTSTDSKDTDGGSDASTTGARTPNILRESRLADDPELKPQKLFAIVEDDDKEVTKLTTSTPPKVTRRGKAASIHGFSMVSPDLNDSDIKRSRAARKGRMSQLLTPLSKEEMINMAELERPPLKRRTLHKITNPIEFVMKKK